MEKDDLKKKKFCKEKNDKMENKGQGYIEKKLKFNLLMWIGIKCLLCIRHWEVMSKGSQ